METVQFSVQMILYIGVGMLAGKVGIATAEFSSRFSSLLVKLLIPCMIFSVIVKNYSADMLSEGVDMMIGCILILLIGLIVSAIVKQFIKKDNPLRPLLIPSVMFMNANIVGFPVIESLLGQESLIYGSFYLLPFRPSFYTMMPILMSDSWGGSFRKTVGRVFKSMLNPCVISSALALAVAILKIPVPKLLMSVVSDIGSTIKSLGMIACGMYLSTVSFKDSVLRKECWLVVLLRNIVVPMVALFVFKLIGFDEYIIKICVIFAALPVPSLTAVFANQAGKDSALAAASTLLSTAASIVTISAWWILLKLV